ncbi:MAG: hypothetical protein ACRDS9_23330 [Pseudonocardiaceae bacterium]
MLSDGERMLLRRLSVFAGGWTLDAAEQVCPGEVIDRYGVLDLLTGLVDKSLVATEERGLETRYRLLETVRQYGAARLAEANEVTGARDPHLAYHRALAERAEPQLLGRTGRSCRARHRRRGTQPACRPRLGSGDRPTGRPAGGGRPDPVLAVHRPLPRG